MRFTFLSLFAAGALVCTTGCEVDPALDPTTPDPATPAVPDRPATEPAPRIDPAPRPVEPTTGDLGTQPGDLPGARAGDPAVHAPSTELRDPTNTGLNERDAVEARPPLPTDQDATGPGLEVTAEIRRQITTTEGMSINARNVKIITEGNTVTLRGPVQDESEKQTIDRIAQEVAGDQYQVVNLLEVQDPAR